MCRSQGNGSLLGMERISGLYIGLDSDLYHIYTYICNVFIQGLSSAEAQLTGELVRCDALRCTNLGLD